MVREWTDPKLSRCQEIADTLGCSIDFLSTGVSSLEHVEIPIYDEIKNTSIRKVIVPLSYRKEYTSLLAFNCNNDIGHEYKKGDIVIVGITPDINNKLCLAFVNNNDMIIGKVKATETKITLENEDTMKNYSYNIQDKEIEVIGVVLEIRRMKEINQ